MATRLAPRLAKVTGEHVAQPIADTLALLLRSKDQGSIPLRAFADRIVVDPDDSLRLELTRCTVDFLLLQPLANRVRW